MVLLYLIPFLHQTTTYSQVEMTGFSCILFHFYIKPQRWFDAFGFIYVVSYSISTSNHNRGQPRHKPRAVVSYSISTSNHNGKVLQIRTPVVVSYSISTSNHNMSTPTLFIHSLYLIPFLHQTTTLSIYSKKHAWLYLIPFLHQTTTYGRNLISENELYLIPFLHQTTTFVLF